MAYDPKDAADKKIVDGLIADALETQASEHETAVEGLKTKNTELLGKLKKAREGKGDPADVERLETELETSKSALALAQKDLKKAQKTAEDATKTAETETAATRKLIVDSGLTSELVANNVAKQYIPAVKSLLSGQVTVKVDGENRVAMVGDKPLSEFVKTWSQGDEGKVYVSAPANGGGNAPGGQANGSGKTMARSVYEANTAAHADFFKQGGTLTEG